MEVKWLGHVVLYVRDLERSRRFYGDVLGWREVQGDMPVPVPAPLPEDSGWARSGDAAKVVIAIARPRVRPAPGCP